MKKHLELQFTGKIIDKTPPQSFIRTKTDGMLLTVCTSYTLQRVIYCSERNYSALRVRKIVFNIYMVHMILWQVTPKMWFIIIFCYLTETKINSNQIKLCESFNSTKPLGADSEIEECYFSMYTVQCPSQRKRNTDPIAFFFSVINIIII